MHNYKFFNAGRLWQAQITCGDDVLNLKNLDRKLWTALVAPVAGLRFDKRTLELLDADKDGFIRAPEVLAAVDWLAARLKTLDSLFAENPSNTLQLYAINADTPEGKNLINLAGLILADKKDAKEITLGEINAIEATFKRYADAQAFVDWCDAGKGLSAMAKGAAYAAFKAVEPKIDAFFGTPDDGPLVAEAPDAALPLEGNLNPAWAAKIAAFAKECLKPDAKELTRSTWESIKARFAPCTAWLQSKPEGVDGDEAEFRKDLASPLAKKSLALSGKGVREGAAELEKLVLFTRHLVEFLNNFVNQAKLYDGSEAAIYRVGTLYIDARACTLSFDVADEGTHSALAARSKCCLLYVKLTRAGQTRTVCAVVTAGDIASLYPGRNGLFIDRDGLDWAATVTKVVEAQVSLKEAFWAPWKKIFNTVGEQLKKFIGSKGDEATAKATGTISSIPPAAPAAPAKPDGAALASSVAALSVGIGMAGAALAGLIGMVAGMPLKDVVLGLLMLILIVSLPSVILTWFNLRDRDLSAILNAGGWAVNRPLRFSLKLARKFTVTGKSCCCKKCLLLILLAIALASAAGAVWAWCIWRNGGCA